MSQEQWTRYDAANLERAEATIAQLRARVAELEAERDRNAPLVAVAAAWDALPLDVRGFDATTRLTLDREIAIAALLDAAAKRGSGT